MSDPSNNNPAPPSTGGNGTNNTKPAPTFSTAGTGNPASPNIITTPPNNTQTISIPIAQTQTYIFQSQPATWISVPFITPEPAVPAVPEKKKSDGCFCKKCKEFYPYAEPNQQDGTLVCYGCKLWSGK